MKDIYCSSIMHKGKQISGGAARNVRIKKAGGLESMIHYAAKTAARLTMKQFMGGNSNKRKKQKH